MITLADAIPDPPPIRPPFLDSAAPYVHVGGWVVLVLALVGFLTALRFRRSLNRHFATATGLSLLAGLFGIACQLF